MTAFVIAGLVLVALGIALWLSAVWEKRHPEPDTYEQWLPLYRTERVVRPPHAHQPWRRG